ncbi:MAG: GNAT family N-acetyltransferase [Rhodoluna sp.]
MTKLQGQRDTLRPLELSDFAPLWDVIGPNEDTWRWVGSGAQMPQTAADLQNEFARKLGREGAEYFAILDTASSEVIGATLEGLL